MEITKIRQWSIDLGSLAGVKEIFRREIEDWQAEESESEDEDDEGDEDSEEEPEAPEADALNISAREDVQPPSTVNSSSPEPSEADTSITEPDDEASALTDDLPHPRPFETLRAFYARTSHQWQELLLEDASTNGRVGKSIKDIRKGAFERAEVKWWDCREEIQALEDEQDEAGIGEVVNLAEKTASAASGVGKRR